MDAAHWDAISIAGRNSEQQAVQSTLAEAPFTYAERKRVLERAQALVAGCRERRGERSLLDLFLQEFGLSNEEGVALMCISEALLRIPDEATAEALIAEKIATANWAHHLGGTDSLFVNASTWALMLTGRVVAPERRVRDSIGADVAGWIGRLVGRIGESAARAAMSRAVRVIAREFVQGRTIEEALAKAGRRGERASFDMLGEGARTFEDADRYTARYLGAIVAVGNAFPDATPAGASGVSIKLSALHPRFEPLQEAHVMRELGARLAELARAAAERNLNLTIDAEEAERLELTLRLFEQLARRPELADWHGLGIAVQAYSKRAPAVIDWLDALARPLMVRLVKGAYWDTEIKRAQVLGLADYPVYTRKAATDLAYLACAHRLLKTPRLVPQFATHNAHTLAAVLELAAGARGKPWEFQRLYGMGELLYDEAARHLELPPVRVYAPVGAHEDLLAYLVRRLLENGANSSFVNRFLDDHVPLPEVVRDPMTAVTEQGVAPHPKIPLPSALFGAERRNSAGLDFGDRDAVQATVREAAECRQPLLSAATRSDVHAAVAAARSAFPAWQAVSPQSRREVLDRLADRIEESRARFVALLAREAGKTLPDAVAEVREAADFCRYYGAECERLFAPARLPGPAGESNTLALHGRGVFACVSPWNFPLAIFVGQLAAAVAAGNCAVAKPAPQTPTIAAAAVQLMAEAGLPEGVVALALGDAQTGAELIDHPDIAGVAFTGATATARRIAQALAAKQGPIVPFIAETGGQNAMVVDSSALPEQVVDDVVTSAFRSAGQRCSALRVLYLQEEIADRIIDLLAGATRALVIGDPANPATDVGPVIDAEARRRLLGHVAAMGDRVLHQCELPAGIEGDYVAPTIIAIDGIGELDAEHFGPVLHVARYAAGELRTVLDDIAAAGYGLTLGIHSRIAQRADEVMAVAKAGNTYVNRDMVGAVVGVQPFGGEGLSGTGPKAGGPHYLPRFAVERTVTWNTAATGGDATLLALS